MARETKHRGPICKECGAEFYYDYIPSPHDGSALCFECWEHGQISQPDSTRKGEDA